MPFHDPYENDIEPGIADLDNARAVDLLVPSPLHCSCAGSWTSPTSTLTVTAGTAAQRLHCQKAA
jgi:hypothetical protein